LHRLVEIVRGFAPVKSLSIIYSTTPDDAEALKDRLKDLAPENEVIMSRFGPVVGTYLGPGALGVGVMSSR
jgi:fatty acid-binding protein DegV